MKLILVDWGFLTRACMIRSMNVDEARGVCKDRRRWHSVVSAYPHDKKGVGLCMYVRNYTYHLNDSYRINVF